MSNRSREPTWPVDLLATTQRFSNSDIICHDYFGNKISLGDYVIANSGLPKAEGREGYVTDIIEYEYGAFIKIATPGGRIIALCDHPCDYIIKK